MSRVSFFSCDTLDFKWQVARCHSLYVPDQCTTLGSLEMPSIVPRGLHTLVDHQIILARTAADLANEVYLSQMLERKREKIIQYKRIVTGY